MKPAVPVLRDAFDLANDDSGRPVLVAIAKARGGPASRRRSPRGTRRHHETAGEPPPNSCRDRGPGGADSVKHLGTDWRWNAFSYAEDAYLNGRTHPGIGSCPSAIGRPGPVVLIIMSILIYDNSHLCCVGPPSLFSVLLPSRLRHQRHMPQGNIGECQHHLQLL